MKTKFFGSMFAVAVMALTVIAGSAQAVSINGDISFGGTFTTDNADFSLATKFVSFSGATVLDEPAVDNGDYEVGSPAVTFTPFTFVPADPSVVPLWTFDFDGKTYSFDATTVVKSFANANNLVVEGEGIAHITGFDDTPGFWVISGNKARASFSFSASASVVPEPATVGVAALGLGTILLRRRKTA